MVRKMGSVSDGDIKVRRVAAAMTASIAFAQASPASAQNLLSGTAVSTPHLLVASGAVLLLIAALLESLRSCRRLKARLARRNHEIERYRLLAEIGSDWIWETDSEHRFTYLSERFSKLCGITSESVIGRTRIELAQADAQAEPWQSHIGMLERREAFRGFIYSVRHPSGRIEWFRVSGQPMRDPTGRFLGYQGTSSRITDEVERNRRQTEQRTLFTYIMRAMPEAMMITTPERKFIEVNDAVERIFGFSRDEMIGQSTSMVYAEIDAFEEQGRLRFHPRARERLEPYIVAYRRKDGSSFSGETLGTVIRAPDGSLVGYLGIVRDATERLRTDEALRQAKEQAEYANRAKSEFLALMSHELRTPLNAILGFSDIVRQEIFGPVGDGRYRDYANDIHNSGQHLLSVINDLLDLSRIEAGRLELMERPIELGKLIAACQRLVMDRAIVGGLSLDAEVPADLPALRADERLLRQILLNLLSNAIKFTDRGGSVAVSAYLGEDGGIRISVADTGIGIAAEDIPKVLQPFRRAVTTRRQIEGAGIGLYLVQSLMRAHGGTLNIESTVGEGTRMQLSFPRHRTVTAADSDAV